MFRPLFKGLRAEIQKCFRWCFGSNENFKICFRDLLIFSRGATGLVQSWVNQSQSTPYPASIIERCANLELHCVAQFNSIIDLKEKKKKKKKSNKFVLDHFFSRTVDHNVQLKLLPKKGDIF